MTWELRTTDEKPVHYRIPVYKVALVRESTLSQLQRPQMCTTADAAQVLSAYLADADREHLVVMLLNSKHRIIGIHTVSLGSLTSLLAHPRGTMKAVVLANAAAFILCHNHPSGDPTPSNEDHALTKRMYAASELLGVQLLDHSIIGDAGRWYSFQDDGALAQATLWRSKGSVRIHPNLSLRGRADRQLRRGGADDEVSTL